MLRFIALLASLTVGIVAGQMLFNPTKYPEPCSKGNPYCTCEEFKATTPCKCKNCHERCFPLGNGIDRDCTGRNNKLCKCQGDKHCRIPCVCGTIPSKGCKPGETCDQFLQTGCCDCIGGCKCGEEHK